LHHDNTPFNNSFFFRKFFTKNQHDCSPHRSYFSLFLLLKIIMIGRPLLPYSRISMDGFLCSVYKFLPSLRTSINLFSRIIHLKFAT
jgi:hypothetical protein